MYHIKELKLDTNILNKLDESFYTHTKSLPLTNPKLVSYNKKLANDLNLHNDTLNSQEFIDLINGSFICDGSITYASAYSGHQFGYPVPNLGDGRALNLGQLDKTHLQLKGSGVTAYSRDGDGRAVLRSSIREYLMSEAMYALGIPTSRALGIISSTTSVKRGYTNEKGSIVLRTSPSWIRFGSFEFAYYAKNKKEQLLKQLADYVIEESYPQLKDKQNRYEELFFAVVDKTIELIAKWQSVGFMHGVMNTDNMSIDGLTIDYGPYAFMEGFDKKFICNTSDHEGRYSFENQPYIAQWNLGVLAKVMSPIANAELMNNYNDSFIGKFKKRYFSIMNQKLGLEKSLQDDMKLVSKLINIMHQETIDYTPFFYLLSCENYDEIKKLCCNSTALDEWLEEYKNRLDLEDISKEQRLKNMRKINPKYVLKNYMLQEAIDKANNDDFSLVNDLLHIAQNPYDEHIKFEKYAHKTPNNVGNMVCSCSS